MENRTVHLEYELPSTKKLLLSTIIALGVAILVLIIFVFPAEYGKDITGLGKLIGLKNMGEIKQSLELERVAADTTVQEVPCDEPEQVVTVTESGLKVDTLRIQLEPGEAAELKLVMEKNAVVDFIWKVNKGHLNFDIHGDRKGLDYYGYRKGNRQTTDSGKLKAAFTGNHGWFWRNRSKVTLEVTLIVNGKYKAVKRVG